MPRPEVAQRPAADERFPDEDPVPSAWNPETGASSATLYD